jgi:hypothetical protein
MSLSTRSTSIPRTQLRVILLLALLSSSIINNVVDAARWLVIFAGPHETHGLDILKVRLKMKKE